MIPNQGPYEWFSKWRKFIYAFVGGIGLLEAYDYGSAEYNKNVCKKFLDKYLAEGIKNGFKDYKISESKSIDYIYSNTDQIKW